MFLDRAKAVSRLVPHFWRVLNLLQGGGSLRFHTLPMTSSYSSDNHKISIACSKLEIHKLSLTKTDNLSFCKELAINYRDKRKDSVEKTSAALDPVAESIDWVVVYRTQIWEETRIYEIRTSDSWVPLSLGYLVFGLKTGEPKNRGTQKRENPKIGESNNRGTQ